MQKIITALDGLSLSTSAIEYTIFVARHFNAHVVAVFLDNVFNHSYSYSELMEEDGSIYEETVDELKERDVAKRQESVIFFEQSFQQAGLPYTIHHDRNMALKELLAESIYADLLVISSEDTFSRLTQQAPTEFLREVLSDVKCPVLVVPRKFRPLEKLVMLYDGSPASVYAVKMFSYLLPELKYLDTEILTVKNEDDTLHLPDNHLMKEFVKRHFPDAFYNVLKGEAEQTIIASLRRSQENAVVVLGAYQRSPISRLFKPSMADQLLKHLKLPLFIAHNK